MVERWVETYIKEVLARWNFQNILEQSTGDCNVEVLMNFLKQILRKLKKTFFEKSLKEYLGELREISRRTSGEIPVGVLENIPDEIAGETRAREIMPCTLHKTGNKYFLKYSEGT